MDTDTNRIKSVIPTGIRVIIALIVLLVGITLAYFLFVAWPTTGLQLIGVLLVIAVGLLSLKIGGGMAARILPDYDTAEVEVEGPITRDGGPRRFPSSPGRVPADDIVEQIEVAANDGNVHGLLVKLNTPGGEVVPSDDIRTAIEEFDGPTVAYATDVCGSGGYWIASACDEIFARDASLVGSIGVLGSRFNAEEFVDKLGVSYERFAAGKFKDTGTPFREMDEDERVYLQGLIDDYYEQFIERVTDGRELDPEQIKETEAKVYLGEDAVALGLIDHIGTRDDAEARLAELLERDSVTVQLFEPHRGLTDRLALTTTSIAFAVGAGFASVLTNSSDSSLDFRL